jgi:putative ABC transport system substrate-binding protein
MRRRDLITLFLRGMMASPVSAFAQGPTAPVIGFLSGQSLEPKLLAKFHEGLAEQGYFEDRNIKIVYRWAHNQLQQLPTLAAELVQEGVALIATVGGLVAAKAARSASNTVPILFVSGLNPAENGFVASLSRPNGNATGVYHATFELVAKRLELMRQIIGQTDKIAYLMNDNSTGLGPGEKTQQEEQKRIASELGLSIHSARNEDEIRSAFALAAQQSKALVVGSHPLFLGNRTLLAALAARYALPAIYARREYAEAGGLVSYGPSVPESWRDIGRYAGRILKGTRPQDLPVIIQNKFELVLNMKTAKMLGVAIPRLLLPDERIE